MQCRGRGETAVSDSLLTATLPAEGRRFKCSAEECRMNMLGCLLGEGLAELASP